MATPKLHLPCSRRLMDVDVAALDALLMLATQVAVLSPAPVTPARSHVQRDIEFWARIFKLVPKRSLQELVLAVYNASSQKRAGTYSSEPLSKFMREYLRAYRTSSKFALRKLTAMVVHGGHRRQAKREWFARTLQLPDTVPQYENAWTKDDCRTILLAVAERDPSSAKLPDI